MFIVRFNSFNVPVFPFHHVTKLQIQGQASRPTIEDGAVPQIELHYKSSEIKVSSLAKEELLKALQRYLEAPAILRSKAGNIIDIVR